jgi:hypothetical protein
LPRQIGWFALVAACIGMVLELRADWRRSAPYAVMVIATLLTFSFLGQAEPRHTIYWVPAFALFAAAAVTGAPAFLGRWAAPALAGFVITGTAWAALRIPAPYVQGYEEAARFIVANNKDSPICLIDTYLEGNIVYYVRLHDPARRLWILRADKVLYSALSDPSYAYVEHVKGQEAILAEIYRHDPELIVVEEPRIGPAMPMAKTLRETLRDHPERFRLEKTVDVDSNQPRLDVANLKIYRNLVRNPKSDHHVDFEMLWLRRRLQSSGS